MIDWPAAISLAVWGLSLWVLWLSAWEAESARIRRAERENGGLRSADPDPLLYSDLEVRFAAWLQFAAFLHAWVQAGGALLPDPRPAWSLALFVPGLLSAAAVLGWGLAMGRRRARPSHVRWALAPIQGLAMWVSWIAAVTTRIRRMARSEDQAPENRSEVGMSEATFREGVEDLVSLTLEEIMIPRSQVVALEGSRSVREAIAVVRRSPHTLYPVYGDSVDQPLGVARILDLIHPEAMDRPLGEFVRPARIVPETMSGLGLLTDLCGAAIPAALVVDEFGGMAGFVTVEDLVEVLVGDLVGEHEVVRDRILSLEQDSYRVDGTCRVEEFNDRFGPLLPEGEYETVAGLFLDKVGRIPQEGDEVKLPRVTLEVLQRTDRRILWLKAVLGPGGGAVSP